MLEQVSKKQPRRIGIPTTDGLQFTNLEDIAETFVRIHHSTVINKFYVEKYIRGNGGQVVMRNGVVLDVSKRKKSDFLQAFGS